MSSSGALFIFLLTISDVSFKEPIELTKLMKAMDECIMFDQKETKDKAKDSRIKSLLPEFTISGRFEENDLESNKLSETTPYLLTNFKSGWIVEVNLKWRLGDIIFSREEIDIRREHRALLDKYLEMQNLLTSTYYRIIEIKKRFESTLSKEERESLEREYELLNAKINILTCHKFKNIHEKEEER